MSTITLHLQTLAPEPIVTLFFRNFCSADRWDFSVSIQLGGSEEKKKNLRPLARSVEEVAENLGQTKRSTVFDEVRAAGMFQTAVGRPPADLGGGLRGGRRLARQQQQQQLRDGAVQRRRAGFLWGCRRPAACVALLKPCCHFYTETRKESRDGMVFVFVCPSACLSVSKKGLTIFTLGRGMNGARVCLPVCLSGPNTCQGCPASLFLHP